MQNSKDIHEKTLKQLMSNLIENEVKESLKKNEEKLILKFNTCLILLKEIEHVVKNATNTWKNVYLIHKLSDFLVSISDKDDEDDQEIDEEKIDEEIIDFDNIDDEEEHEQEATKEGTQDVEETDPSKIATIVIASLRHSPRKTVTTSSTKTTSAGLIVSITASTSIQSIFALVHLSISLTEVSNT
jgi:Na+-transporting methylmalonyl-CoA/oxaloacetate decarboxylase gamma subunit